MELLEVLITPSQTVTVPAGYYGNCSVPTTADTEINETLHCSGTASATGTINDNDAAPTVADHSCFGYRRILLCLNSA
jgi:hypothetical protein